MICVTIARPRHRHVLAEHRFLVEEEGVQLVELRLDYINGRIGVKRLIVEGAGPVVVSCRRQSEGGKFPGTEEERITLLRTAVAEGADYVDLEEDIAGKIPRYGKTKRIVSLHDFEKTPEDLEALQRRLAELDPDVIKICTMATRPGDNLRMLRLVAASKIPTVGFCMGELGMVSRILTGRFGAPVTYAAFHRDQAVAPGMLGFEEMRDLYRYDRIDRETDVYGVIADPVGHSLSPLIHNRAFAELKLNKVYVPLRIPPRDLAQFLDEAPELGIKGLSVTIPHKEAVLAKLTEADELVRGIGACNTVIFDAQKRLGYNTDCQAAMESLEDALGGAADGGPSPLRGKTALVLGAGGVGKAIAVGLVNRGAQVALADGEAQRAEQLAGRLECRHVDWSERHSVAADVLVNATPLGMHPNVDATPFDKEHLREGTVVFDAVYTPEETLFIRNARERNCPAVTGVDMFVRQACLQFRHFTGRDGPADLMREVIKRETGG
jgi:3-dehydroquinate dehydratase/shikimate dehydrogenase